MELRRLIWFDYLIFEDGKHLKTKFVLIKYEKRCGVWICFFVNDSY